jgi:hypothetical protein
MSYLNGNGSEITLSDRDEVFYDDVVLDKITVKVLRARSDRNALQRIAQRYQLNGYQMEQMRSEITQATMADIRRSLGS